MGAVNMRVRENSYLPTEEILGTNAIVGARRCFMRVSHCLAYTTEILL